MKRRDFLKKGKKVATVAATAVVLKVWVSPQIISLEDDAFADKKKHKPKCTKHNESVEKRLKKCRKKKEKKFS